MPAWAWVSPISTACFPLAACVPSATCQTRQGRSWTQSTPPAWTPSRPFASGASWIRWATRLCRGRALPCSCWGLCARCKWRHRREWWSVGSFSRLAAWWWTLLLGSKCCWLWFGGSPSMLRSLAVCTARFSLRDQGISSIDWWCWSAFKLFSVNSVKIILWDD